METEIKTVELRPLNVHPFTLSFADIPQISSENGGGRAVRWSWVNFQCRGVLLVWIRVGQGPTALAVGAGGGCLDIFTLIYPFSLLSPSLWETTRYRLKYCLRGSLIPKTTNQQNRPRIMSCRITVLHHKQSIKSWISVPFVRSAKSDLGPSDTGNMQV